MKKLSLALTMAALTGVMSAHAATIPVDLLGDVVDTAQATRSIDIQPSTRYVNVTHGEIVRFVAGGQTFAFNFDGADGAESFDLQRVAPAGLLDHSVVAYIQPNRDDGR